MDRILEEYFTPEDDFGARGRNPETVAAYVAVKRALLKLHQSGTKEDHSPQNFAIKKDKDGAPYVEGGDIEVRVSMAHTDERAFGMVVYEEAED
jgi:phosphopantetheinyl transferase (holo-ACP synthase)